MSRSRQARVADACPLAAEPGPKASRQAFEEKVGKSYLKRIPQQDHAFTRSRAAGGLGGKRDLGDVTLQIDDRRLIFKRGTGQGTADDNRMAEISTGPEVSATRCGRHSYSLDDAIAIAEEIDV